MFLDKMRNVQLNTTNLYFFLNRVVNIHKIKLEAVSV